MKQIRLVPDPPFYNSVDIAVLDFPAGLDGAARRRCKITVEFAEVDVRQLQARGLQPGQKPELAALEMPEVLTAIHTDYANAGADILLANTFGANAKKLTGCGHTVEEVVSASIACARVWRWTSALWVSCSSPRARWRLRMPTMSLHRSSAPVRRQGLTSSFWRR